MAFQLIPFLINLLIGLALQVIGFLLMPKPATQKPDEVRDMDDPTAEGGRPIPVVFGEVEVHAVNIVWFGDKSTTVREVAA